MSKLDPFLQERADYIALATQHAAIALQWQATEATENAGAGYPIGEDGDEYTDRVGDLITEQVTAFVEDNWQLLGEANVKPEQCGHDFILTANRHGAGFWDRGLGAAGEILTEATRGYSFDAEFLLDEDGEVKFLMVENTIITGTPDM